MYAISFWYMPDFVYMYQILLTYARSFWHTSDFFLTYAKMCLTHVRSFWHMPDYFWTYNRSRFFFHICQILITFVLSILNYFYTGQDLSFLHMSDFNHMYTYEISMLNCPHLQLSTTKTTSLIVTLVSAILVDSIIYKKKNIINKCLCS
jgi:hypothetical protein